MGLTLIPSPTLRIGRGEKKGFEAYLILPSTELGRRKEEV